MVHTVIDLSQARARDGIGTIRGMTRSIDDLGKYLPVGPTNCRLIVGMAVYTELAAATGPAPQDYRAPYVRNSLTLKALEGITVEIDDSMAPNAWRIVDPDRGTLSEGTIGSGWERDAIVIPDDNNVYQARFLPGPARIVP